MGAYADLSKNLFGICNLENILNRHLSIFVLVNTDMSIHV